MCVCVCVEKGRGRRGVGKGRQGRAAGVSVCVGGPEGGGGAGVRVCARGAEAVVCACLCVCVLRGRRGGGLATGKGSSYHQVSAAKCRGIHLVTCLFAKFDWCSVQTHLLKAACLHSPVDCGMHLKM